VPHEIEEIAAVGFDRVIRQQRVADPGDQGGGRPVGVAAGGLEGAGQEGLDLVGGGGVAFEEVAALGQQGSAGGCRLGIGRGDGRVSSASVIGLSRSFDDQRRQTRTKAPILTGFSVVSAQSGTVAIESAGEPVIGFSRTFDDARS
jgi:hypothetical protein